MKGYTNSSDASEVLRPSIKNKKLPKENHSPNRAKGRPTFNKNENHTARSPVSFISSISYS